MQDFIIRYYRVFYISLIGILLSLVFYAGFLEGKASKSDQVTLSCSEDVLKTLTIPLQSIASEGSRRVNLEDGTNTLSLPNTDTVSVQNGTYVGSKNGTKYYKPNCGTVKRIKPENYVWFQTEEDAQLQGYTLGKC